jgi:hypothetical protein
MYTDAAQTLNDLHVIAVISHNDKLITNGVGFDIYTPTTLRGLVRFLYGEGRAENVTRVRRTVESAVVVCQQSVANLSHIVFNESIHDPLCGMHTRTTAMNYVRMVDALCRSQYGLRNLMQTYRDDVAIVAQIHLIVQDVSDFLSLMDPHTARLQSVLGSPARASPVIDVILGE